MVEIYRSIKANVNRYIEAIRNQISKEELVLKKEENQYRRFLLNLCVLINTVDYIKETVSKMNDVILNLIDEPYNQNLDFSDEEDACSKVCVEIINSILKLYESKLDATLTTGMLKVQWDRLENVTLVSSYINDLKNLMNSFAEAIKERVNNVYVVRTLRGISEVTNAKFIDVVYKIKKINENSVQQLHVGEINRFCRNETTIVQFRFESFERTYLEYLQLSA